MASLFDRIRGRKEPTSAEIAKERLKLVLVTDRSNLSPEKLEEMQREIILVIKRYIPINEMEVQINIEQRERKHYLVADVPLSRSPNYGALDAPEPYPGGEAGHAADDVEAADDAGESDLAAVDDTDEMMASAGSDEAVRDEAEVEVTAGDVEARDVDDTEIAEHTEAVDEAPAAPPKPRRKRSS